jgi:hypothetical protein
MQKKWRRRIRWFFEHFTPGFTMYSESGDTAIYYKHGVARTVRFDVEKAIDRALEERARLDAIWEAEQKAAVALNSKDQG